MFPNSYDVLVKIIFAVQRRLNFDLYNADHFMRYKIAYLGKLLMERSIFFNSKLLEVSVF